MVTEQETKRAISLVKQIIQRGKEIPDNYQEVADACGRQRSEISRLMNGHEVSHLVVSAVLKTVPTLLNSFRSVK